MENRVGSDAIALMKLADVSTVEELNDLHFFVEMEGVDPTPFCAFGIGIGVSDGKNTWRECSIDNSRYDASEGYKITLRAIDGSHGYNHYYTSDLVSLIRSGYAFIKKDPSEKIERNVICFEELLPGVNLVHCGDLLILSR